MFTPAGLSFEGAAGGDLVIVRRWYRPYWLKRAAIQMLPTLAVAAAWYFLITRWQSIAIAVPLALVSAFLLFVDYITLTRFVNRTKVRVSPREIRVEHGPLPAFIASRTVPVEHLTQLFSVANAYGCYEVRALLRDGSVHVLVELIGAVEQARHIEREIERVLEIADFPVAGQVMPAEELAQKKVATSAAPGCMALAIGAAIVPLLGGVFYLHYFVLRGEELGAMAVSEQPATMQISLAEGRTRLVFWDEVDITVPIKMDERSVDRMPHLLDYAIEVHQDGATVAELRCNAFDSNIFDWSSRTTGWSEADHEWKGKLNRCTVDLPKAGEVTVRARRVWRMRPAGVTLRKTILIPMSYEP